MPQSLLVSTPPQASSTKRQRSADSRDPHPHPRPDSAGQNGSKLASSRPSRTPLKANVRIPAYLEKSRSEILATFQEVEWKQRFRLFHAMEHPDTSPYKVDRSEVVISRNRYGNVQPWDASRIKLKTPICGSDYVNASPIVLKSRSRTSLESRDKSAPPEVKYIATQGPKQGQKSHFWHMVHQETPGDTGVVIMLTQLVEENKEKCAQYYPVDLEDPTMVLLHEEKTSENGDTCAANDANNIDDSTTAIEPPQTDTTSSDTITLLSKEFDSSVGCEVRKLRLTIDNIPKTILHYLFGRWADFGKPEAADRKALIELSRRTYHEAGNSPRVVHCSAGVGRTGTWIALDFLIREVEEDRLLDSMKGTPKTHNQNAVQANSEINKTETWGKSGPQKVSTPTQEDGFDKDEHDLIYETVNTLRDQRMMMVIREVQFSFLYEAVREAVLEKYRARPEGALVTPAADLDTPPPNKSRRVSEEGTAEGSASEAETEIMDVDVRQNTADDSDEDPYAAVSPVNVRRGMSRENSQTS